MITFIPRRAPAFGLALTLLTALDFQAVAEPGSSCSGPLAPVWISAGSFTMGNEVGYPEEGPETAARLDGFWLDATEVTVGAFSEFVEETGYVTVAERPVDPSQLPDIDPDAHPEYADLFKPGGAVFNPDPRQTARNMNWWSYVPGADWRHPEGPDKLSAEPDEPVTQIAYEDARAYAAWAGGRLPSEAEWEFAALAGQGNNQTERPKQANTWQGIFPVADTGDDGFKGVAPVGCFSANANGLHDMLGNVWEWTADRYVPYHQPDGENPEGPAAADSFAPGKPGAASHVIKGGSFLCAENYCRRYRAAARQPQETGLGTNHIGFRVAYDRPAPDEE
ncbi:formylglycine-generating enzyme family protein [Henriciella aquimarina]|uniref:formylglycine-generating enzyme family protein n=1 Tax=Henriciella aquimarina TaxID=545261 RepID=UPI001F36A6B0|nr:formylglycine-generating enzyme family protein [Henriciella aquimarina]